MGSKSEGEGGRASAVICRAQATCQAHTHLAHHFLPPCLHPNPKTYRDLTVQQSGHRMAKNTDLEPIHVTVYQ